MFGVAICRVGQMGRHKASCRINTFNKFEYAIRLLIVC